MGAPTAGPMGCENVADEDDREHDVVPPDGAINNMQLALLPTNLDQRFVLMNLGVEPLQCFDPVLEQILEEITARDVTAPVGDELSQQIFNAPIPHQPTAETQQQPPPDVPNDGRTNELPARNTRRQARLAAARRPFYARAGRGGRGRGRADEQRSDVHITSERNRSREMSEQFDALRMMLPSSATMSRMDRSSIVMGAIDFIAALEVELARLRDNVAPRTSEFPATSGLVCVDHTADANALTAVTTWPTPQSDPSAMASFLGTNVALHVCGQNCFVTVSSPHRVSHLRQYAEIFMVLFGHHLEVVSGSITTRDNTVVYTITCQAQPNANLLSNDLHAALQNVVNEFIRSDSELA